MCERELAAALAGDLDGVFEQLVTAYQPRVFGFLLRLAANRQDAEELAQDTFVRAYQAMAGYPPERVRDLRLASWLYQIALNLFRNARRRRSPPTLSLGDAGDDRPELDVADDALYEPAVQTDTSEERRELARLIAALPPHFRAAVVLRHVEGRSYAEMARILGAPVGTVKSHTHRGTLLLRTMLVARESEVHV
jgi:RNA polymerase sigma-70 factor (ECF subfamily)